MNYYEAKKKILAANALLAQETTTREKFGSICTLTKGIHPTIDKTLIRAEEQLCKVEKYIKGEVIQLSLEHLPEDTEEQKKRKKALLFFLNTWNQLKGEIKRVEKELDASHKEHTASQKQSHWTKIFQFAKGPFGVVTIVAIGILLVLQSTSVSVVIKNNGCETIPAPAFLPIPLPGFSLPKNPIPNNGSAIATVPPLTVTVNGMQPGTLTVHMLGITLPYQVPGNIRDITLNDTSLIGKETKVTLSERKQHILTFNCLNK